MAYYVEAYRHSLDQRAFDALNTFPKFVKLCEAFSANYSEIIAKIGNMEHLIRLNENQMPEVYAVLPPICEKLGIEVPELYYEKSKELNACTGGTAKPYIIVTSKLVDKLSKEQLASVIAHECGHIACKHNLYHSMAGYLIDGIDNSPLASFPGVRRYLTPTMVKALIFWDRCSELSADRAAVLCDGNADVFIGSLLKVHGYGEDINKDEFIKQALDLKEFLNDSKSTKALDQLLNQWNSHPSMATRAYECYDFANSDLYKQILDGTYNKVKEEKVEEEVVAAEVNVEAKNGAASMTGLSDNFNLDAELERVNKELERYTCDADKVDYALAVISGIYSGIIDALFVGECTVTSEGLGLNHKQVNEFIQNYADARGIGKDRLKDAISELEKTFKVAQDNVWKGAGIGVSAKNHHLADLAHHPTPIGLMASIVVQFLRIGTFVNKEGEWPFIPVKTNFKDIIEVLGPAILTGILNWLVCLAEKTYEEETGKEVPKALSRLVHIVASTPILIEVAKCADNWFGHLVSDMGGSKNTAGGGMGIPGIFVSLLYEMASLPLLKDTGLPAFVDELYVNRKIDFRHELSIYKNIGKQAIPVAFNEIYVRLGYFISHLAREISDYGIKGVHWNKVVPFGNRTIDRMMMIASMTFNVADTADAAVHAAIESCGNWVLFSGIFVTRFNYVGAGRAAIAIVKEITNEKKEAELIHQKLILTEAKTAGVIQMMNEYREELEQRVSDYLAEDLEVFLTGFDYMKQGINAGDSDLVIKGNVVIQRVLGRKPQFTNQKEFDDLMKSDEAIIL